MHKRAVLIPILLVVIGCSYAWYVYASDAGANNGNIEGSGTIEAVELNIGSQIAAEVNTIMVAEGKTVEKGDTIAILDDRLLKDQLLSASAGVEAAKAAIDDAGTTSAKNIAKAQLKQAEAASSIAQTQYTFAVIQAPIDGIVLSLPYAEGEVVSPGSTVAVVGKTSELDLTIYIDEKELGKAKIGQKVEVTVDAYPGIAFGGRVIEIASDAEFTPQNIQTKEQRSNLVFAVKVRVDNANGKLKAGMPADAVFK